MPIRGLGATTRRVIPFPYQCDMSLPLLGGWAVERSAPYQEEPAQRAGDTEQNALPPKRLARTSHLGQMPWPVWVLAAGAGYGFYQQVKTLDGGDGVQVFVGGGG